MEEKLIKGIQVLTTKIKKENDLEENSLIRDEVFNILQKLPDCNVLYYPLSEEANEDGCDGCHIVRTIRGKARHLVYINTANTRERQAFSVAHELGHIWKVDEQLMEIVPDVDFDVEDVINRFAAELLMPEQIFVKQTQENLDKYASKDRQINVSDFVKTIVYLMNYFFVPYKAVVLRIKEVGLISEDVKERLLKYKESPYVKSIIQDQYTRLGITNGKISVSDIADKVDYIEKNDLFSENKIDVIRQIFCIEKIAEDSEMEESVEFDIP